MKKAWMHWSGGKDSAYALWRVRQCGEHEIEGIITSFSEEFRRVSMHGVEESLVEAQARAMGLSIQKFFLPKNCSMSDYEACFEKALSHIPEDQVHLFGDLYLEDLRAYREEMMETVGRSACFPIWREASSAQLAERIQGSGIKAVVVSVSGNQLDRSWLGREFDASFLKELPKGVDPCGERGEFHTFVYDSPLFHEPLKIELGQQLERHYTLQPDDQDWDCCKVEDSEFYFQEVKLKQ